MIPKLTALLAFASLLTGPTAFSQSALKKIKVIVIDNSTQKPASEVTVQIKGVLSGGKSRQTDVYGVAYFEVLPILASVKIEAKDENFMSSRSAASLSLPITSTQES